MKTFFTTLCGSSRALWIWGLLALATLTPLSGWASANGLVISQVYGGGGNTSSYYTNDFIELFNNSNTDFLVPTGGYSVQYSPATGSSWSVTAIPAGTVIPARGYFLVQQAAGTGGVTGFASDLQGSINLAATNGKVALVSSTTALTGTQAAPSGTVIDLVGFGTANAFETSVAAAPSAINSIARKGSGTVDTDNNGADFQLQVAAPRSSAMPTVVTGALSGVFPTYTPINAEVLRVGGTAITERGVLYSTSPSPRLGSAQVANGPGGTGSYINKLNGLTPGITYYLVAFSTNANGTSYGSDVALTTPVSINLYAKPTGTLDDLTTFGTNTNGTGTSPDSFTDAGQVYVVTGTNRTIATDLYVSGTNSKLLVDAGASLLLPLTANYNGPLDLAAGATLVNTSPASNITFGNLAANSTVEYAQPETYTVPLAGGAGYGNLTLRNGTKRLSAGNTVVRGNFLVSNVGASGSDVFGGTPFATSTLTLGGNMTLMGPVNFSTTAEDRISLVANGTAAPQTIDGSGNVVKLYQLTLASGQAGLSLVGGTTNLELGNSSGGGYLLNGGTTLSVNNNTLAFAAGSQAAIAGTGLLDLAPGSSLLFSKSSALTLGTLRLTPNSTELYNLTVDASGTGSAATNTLTLPGNLTVTGTLTLANGVLAITAGKMLTLSGALNASSTGLLRAVDADLTINGFGLVNSLSFAGGTGSQVRNLTLNRVGQTLNLASNLNVTGTLTLANGILDIGARDLTLSGAVACTGTGLLNGSFASNLRVSGTGPLGNVAFTPYGGLLNILNLNRPGGTLTVSSATLQVDKPTLVSGVLALGAGTALGITGPLVVADPAVAQFAGTPTSSISFTDGGAIGAMAFVPGQDVLQNFTLARASTSAVPTMQLVSNLSVNSLTLNRGRIFVQGNYKLTVLPGGGVSGGGPNSYVNTLTQAAVTNVFTSTVALAYPLGVDGQYRPLTFSVTDQTIGTASYTAHQYEAPSPVRTLPSTLARVSQIRYYNVVREAGGTSTLQSANIRLSYVANNDLVTAANVGFLRVAMTDPNDPGKWANIGGAGTASDILSASFPAGPLGDFTLATDIMTPINTNPLPVELSAFGARRQADKTVSVTWTTASEKNSDRFEVQRSLDGRDFATIATAAAQGSSNQATTYAALDKTAPAATLYYRLRQVDLDGTVAYSAVVTVAGVNAPLELALYPNPTTDRITATLPADAGRTYRVLNTLGQVLARGAADAANPEVNVQALPAGTYLLELQGAAGRQVRRFVKND